MNSPSFLHLGDPHLGYEQYGSRERFEDFYRSFLKTLKYAIDQNIKLIVIPGDLFDAKAIDPLTHFHAVTAFEKCRQHGIIVTVTEGNHDNARYQDTYSWLKNLSSLGLIYLLGVKYGDTGIEIVPWDESTKSGSYIDTPEGIRVYGIQYYGASTHRVLEDFAEKLEDPHAEGVRCSILCLHVGMEEAIPGMAGGLSPKVFDPIKKKIDYVALGHIHKKYEVDGWIYNPGSIEPCSMEEAKWRGGAYHVDLAGDALHPFTVQKHLSVRTRSFLPIQIVTDGLTDPEQVYEKIAEEVLKQKTARERGEEGARAPVIEATLRGQLEFSRTDLDLHRIKSILEELEPIAISDIRNETIPRDLAAAQSVETGTKQSKSEIELSIFKQILERDARFADNAEHHALIVAQIKNMALENRDPADIVDFLARDIGAVLESEAEEVHAAPPFEAQEAEPDELSRQAISPRPFSPAPGF